MPRLLELFCGTKSIGRVFERGGWDVTSVDLSQNFEPTICCNILDLTSHMILDYGTDISDTLIFSPILNEVISICSASGKLSSSPTT